MKPTTCQASVYHRPRPVQIDVHHILPKEFGGKTVPGNTVPICGACHEAVHALLREYERLNGLPTWIFRRRFPRGVQRLAARGWALITDSRS